jgi:hypothetical protein
VGRRAPGALFKQARVSLEEEDVVEEVEREGAEVEEGRYEAPILSPCQSGVCLCTEHACRMRTWLRKNTARTL